MLHAIRTWLSPTAQLLTEVKQLAARVRELEQAELERETNVADQIDKLQRMVKRIRQRAYRANNGGDEDDDGIDPISRMILERRARLSRGGE